MTVYFGLFGVIFGLEYFLKKYVSRKRYLLYYIILGILFILIASLRYGIGFDYRFYQTMFQTVSQQSFKDILLSSHKEWGFLFLNKIVSYFGGGYHTFLFVANTILIFSVLFFVYRYSPLPWLSLFLFVALQFYAQSMNLLRQSLAASIFLFAYGPFVKRQFLKYIIIVGIAGLFHQTVFIMLPFYFICCKKLSWKEIVLLLIGYIIFYFLFDRLFDIAAKVFLKDYAGYINSIYWNGNGFSYAIMPIGYLILVLYAKKNLEETRENNIFIQMGIWAFFFLFFITKHFILERMSVYFFQFSILFIPKIVMQQRENKRIFYSLVSVILVSSICYFSFAAMEGFHRVYPYYSIFDRIENAPTSSEIPNV